jgi:hypothetical protein
MGWVSELTRQPGFIKTSKHLRGELERKLQQERREWLRCEEWRR